VDQQTGMKSAGWVLTAHGGLQVALTTLGLVVIWLTSLVYGSLGAVIAISEGETGAAVGLFLMGVATGLACSIIVLPFLITYLLQLAAGVQLLRRREWAVIPATVLALLGIWAFPLGTMTAIVATLVLWVPRLSEPADGVVAV